MGLAACGAALVAACGTDGDAEVATTVSTTAAPTTTSTTTSTSTTTTTTTTTTTVPVTAAAAPAKPRAQPARLGTIEIPSLGVSKPIYEGVDLWIFDIGVGHWPGTAKPGQSGNVVLGGHRTSGIRPFRYIDQLQPGNEIRVITDQGTYLYRVSGSTVVDPIEGMWIINSTPTATMTLFACHPPGSVSQRIVVFADYAGMV